MPFPTPTILVNTWNHARWIRSCVESALNQEGVEPEIVVHDDGSSDETPEILRSFGDRVRVIRSERDSEIPPHLRQARAIQLAFESSVGDPVFLLDGDDCFRPGKLRAYAAAFQAPDSPILLQSPLQWINENGEEIPTLQEDFRLFSDPAATARAKNQVDLFVPTSALAFRRGFLEKALPLDYSHGRSLWPDTVLCIRALVEGPLACLAQAWGCRRIHPESDSAQRQKDRFHLVRQTLDKIAVFNHFAAKAGQPLLNPLKNRSLPRQFLGALIPLPARKLRARFCMYPQPVD